MNLKHLGVRACAAAAILALAMAITATAGATAPTAHSARSCSHLPGYPGDGYFTSLSVAHVTCTTGKRVMRDHYRCRTRHGIRGRCTSVDRYRCSEQRDSISTEFVAKVTCKRGHRKVVYTYLQRT